VTSEYVATPTATYNHTLHSLTSNFNSVLSSRALNQGAYNKGHADIDKLNQVGYFPITSSLATESCCVYRTNLLTGNDNAVLPLSSQLEVDGVAGVLLFGTQLAASNLHAYRTFDPHNMNKRYYASNHACYGFRPYFLNPNIWFNNFGQGQEQNLYQWNIAAAPSTVRPSPATPFRSGTTA
jgi:hypothetical protein